MHFFTTTLRSTLSMSRLKQRFRSDGDRRHLLADLSFHLTIFSRASTTNVTFERYFRCRHFSVSPQSWHSSKPKLLPSMSNRRQLEQRLQIWVVRLGIHELLHILHTGNCRPQLSLPMSARRRLHLGPSLRLSTRRQFDVRQLLQVSECRLFSSTNLLTTFLCSDFGEVRDRRELF